VIDTPEPRYISCTLSQQYINILSGLIEQNPEFKDISIITDTNIAILFSIEPEIIPEDNVWTVLEIPYCINMCHFYTEFSRSLCEEHLIRGCGEKRG